MIHSSVSEQLACFHILVILNNATVNMEVHISFWVTVLIFLDNTRSGIAILHDNSIFNFLRKLHTVLLSGFINSHSHQQCTRLPFPPHLPFKWLLLAFLIIAILTGVGWCIFVVLMSLVASNDEHLFKYLLALCMSSLDKCYSNLLSVFYWIFFFFFC